MTAASITVGIPTFKRAARSPSSGTTPIPIGLSSCSDSTTRLLTKRVASRGNLESVKVGPPPHVRTDHAPSAYRLSRWGPPAVAFQRSHVVCREGTIAEVLEDGVSGLLMSPGDSVALANSASRLIDNPADARRMGVAHHRRVRENMRRKRSHGGRDGRCSQATCPSPSRKTAP